MAGKNKKDMDIAWLAIAIACFCTGAFWWAGVALIVLNAKGKLPPLMPKIRQKLGLGPVEPQQPEPAPVIRRTAPKQKKSTGLAAIITGGCLGGVGALVMISTFWDMIQDLLWGFWDASWLPYYLEDGFVGLLFLAAGAIVAGVGINNRREDKAFRRYFALIGDHTAVSIHALADATGTKYEKVCKQLQKMIDKGWFGDNAYIDQAKGRLLLDGIDLTYREAEPEPEPTAEQTISEEEKILRQIRADNDLIDNEEISRKIDRIEELTRRIFAYIREKPSKAGELRSFLNYYLPQTLKILETYARLEAQDVEGENINAAKTRIEGVMDKLVESYERQLDKLFEGDVIDITTDIEVMETMLARDGLTADALTKK